MCTRMPISFVWILQRIWFIVVALLSSARWMNHSCFLDLTKRNSREWMILVTSRTRRRRRVTSLIKFLSLRSQHTWSILRHYFMCATARAIQITHILTHKHHVYVMIIQHIALFFNRLINFAGNNIVHWASLRMCLARNELYRVRSTLYNNHKLASMWQIACPDIFVWTYVCRHEIKDKLSHLLPLTLSLIFFLLIVSNANRIGANDEQVLA